MLSWKEFVARVVVIGAALAPFVLVTLWVMTA